MMTPTRLLLDVNYSNLLQRILTAFLAILFFIPSSILYSAESDGSKDEERFSTHIIDNIAEAFVEEPGSLYSMTCKGQQNISLGAECELTITPGMVLLGNFVESDYSVMLLDNGNRVIPGATFNENHIGHLYTVKVIENATGNSCWSTILVEDKLPPFIECPPTDSMPCYQTDMLAMPIVEDNCSESAYLKLLDSVFIPIECDTLLVGEIVRTFAAYDDKGQFSEPCTDTTRLTRVKLSEIDGPMDREITCEEYINNRDDNDALDPEYFGVPMIGSVPLYPNTHKFCNLDVFFKDKSGGVIGLSGNVKKIIRTWYVYEWHCEDPDPVEFTQVLKLIDNEHPLIDMETVPDSLVFSANSGACEAYGYFPPIDAVEDDCFDNEWHVRIDGILNTNGGYAKMVQGVHYVDYIVTDNRGNADTVEVKVIVKDLTAPTVVCIQYMVISLDRFGQAVLPAEAVNNGSTDACGIDYVEVRRMDDGVACQDTSFSPYVEFCCEDAGLRRMVELRVWDKNNNSNTCMAEIEVQDKYNPYIEPLPDLRFECGTDIKPFLEEPVVIDSCDFIVSDTLIYNLNSCGVGTITRIVTAEGANGSSQEIQTITIYGEGVFEMHPDDWPADVDTFGICGPIDLTPDSLPIGARKPYLPYGMCSDVYMTHTDDVYRFADNEVSACYKIIRRWTVIDWCQKDPESGEPKRWEHEQVIKVSNTDKPEITSIQDTVIIETLECDSAPVKIKVAGQDSCTQAADLVWEYKLDLNDDGIFEDGVKGKGDTALLMDQIEVGEHSIVWSFYDQCGNTVSRKQYLFIYSTKPPSIVPVQGVAVGLTPMDLEGNDNIPDDEMACIGVDSLIASSSHPCGIPFDVSFSPDSIVKEMCFNCLDIGINEIWIYAIDNLGNIDSVQIVVDVQDNNNVDICASARDCIIFPPDVDVTECIPDFSPAVLGRPIIDPDCICLDTLVTFMDEIIAEPGIDCTARVRTWSVTFNCGLRPLVYTETQNINVMNFVPPVIECPDTIRMEVDMNSCEVFVQMDSVFASGICNTGIIITNSYNGGGPDASGIYPVDTTTVEFVAVNDCGLSSSCDVVVIVEDNIPPVCNPVDSVVITITGGTSFTILDPMTLDNGSTDNCGEIVRYELSDSTFTCAEIGMEDITTILIIYDASGNFSECEVRVIVEDGEQLNCEAIENLTVYLDENGEAMITPFDIDGGSGAGCEVMPELSIDRDMFSCSDVLISPIVVTLKVKVGQDSLECGTLVTVKDTLLPDGTIKEDMKMINCDEFSGDIKLELDGVFGISDNCDSSTVMVDTVITNSTNICGEGSYFVKLIMTDICGNIDSTGEVEIMIVNDNPFTIDSIIFPEPEIIRLDSCGDISPMTLGSDIVINDDGGICSNVISFYVDDTLTNNFFCNDTIRRIWTVQDSCQLDGMGGGMWQDTQFIIITDTIAPVVEGPPNMTLENSNNTVDCVVTVVLMAATATDNCTPSDQIIFSNNSPFANDTLSGDISGDYEPGEYDIEIYGEDLCGNVDTFRTTLIIEQPSGEGLPCSKEIARIRASLTVTVTPEDFGVQNFTDCYNPEGFIFTFDRNDLNASTKTYTCDDVGLTSPDNPLGLNLPIYAFTQMGEYVDSCRATVAVVDFLGFCPDNAAQGVGGDVFTYGGENIEGVNIKLEGDINEIFRTNDSGSYAFTNLQVGSNFNIVPFKNDDVLNGVNTLDLIKIQRHILGLEEFDNAFQYVAADINNSMSLSVVDILELRKVLLGIYDEFNHNDSWRMVDGNYTFPENDDPLSVQWPETYSIKNLESFMKVDFVGVKIGDVDGDAKTNLRNGITTRSNQEISIGKESAENQVLLKSMDNMEIYGLQMSLNVPFGNVQLSSSLPGFNESHYFENNGTIRISWNADQPVALNKDEVIFTIKGINDSYINDDILSPSIYVSENGDHIVEYTLTIVEVSGQNLQLLPNTPNPWSDFTEIRFNINYEDTAVLNFYGSNGKLLAKRMINTHPGINKVRIQKEDLMSSGLIIYEIISNKEKSQGKMILLK